MKHAIYVIWKRKRIQSIYVYVTSTKTIIMENELNTRKVKIR